MRTVLPLALLFCPLLLSAQDITNSLGAGGNFKVDNSSATTLFQVSETNGTAFFTGTVVGFGSVNAQAGLRANDSIEVNGFVRVSDSLSVAGPITSTAIKGVGFNYSVGVDDQVLIFDVSIPL